MDIVKITEIVKFILLVIGIPSAVVAFFTLLWKGFKEIKKRNDRLDEIPMVIESLEEIKTDTKTNKKNMEKLTNDLKEVKGQMEAHVLRDESKDTILLKQAKEFLISDCKKFLKLKKISAQELAVLRRLYNAYTALGGNGEVEILFKQVEKLELSDGSE